MKTIEHPNIINLIEVIDDPDSANLYLGNIGRSVNPFFACVIYNRDVIM